MTRTELLDIITPIIKTLEDLLGDSHELPEKLDYLVSRLIEEGLQKQKHITVIRDAGPADIKDGSVWYIEPEEQTK